MKKYGMNKKYKYIIRAYATYESVRKIRKSDNRLIVSRKLIAEDYHVRKPSTKTCICSNCRQRTPEFITVRRGITRMNMCSDCWCKCAITDRE